MITLPQLTRVDPILTQGFQLKLSFIDQWHL